MSLHANQPVSFAPAIHSSSTDIYGSIPSTTCSPTLACSAPLKSVRLPLIEQKGVILQAFDPQPINLMASGSPAMGITIMVGSCSVLLAFFWLRICRLTSMLRRRDQRIQKLLALDSLTSLNNRDTLLQAGEQLLLTFPRANVALLSLSIHQLRAVNDEFGHAVGDELLQQLARRLQTCIEPQDSLARVGDARFSLLLSPYYDAPETRSDDSTTERAQALADRILGVLHQPFYVRTHTICVTASVGIAISGRSGQRSISRLLSQSMVALAQAEKKPTHSRQEPEQRYAVFVPEMESARASRAQMRRDLAQAIENQALRVRYQPIVSLKTQQTVGFEVLVRWQHPTLGLLSPDRFLPLAEEMGLIVDIDRWVLETACQQLESWQSEQLTPSLSVNLSGMQLSQPDVVPFVRSLLSRYAIAPSQLNLEVTESVLIAEPTQAIATLRQLRQMGLRVSLDDFGTGYSSLEYLSQFPVDVLKIDKSFITAIDHSREPDLPQETDTALFTETLSTENCQNPHHVILRSILSLAQGLALEVVAEGIESCDQCTQLWKVQCTYGQGNFFAKPMTGVAASALLKRMESLTEQKDNKRRTHQLTHAPAPCCASEQKAV